MLPFEVQSAANIHALMRWYRSEVPPGVTAVVPPRLEGPYRMFLNGTELKPEGGDPIDICPLRRAGRNTLVIVARAGDRLSSPLEYVSGATPLSLVSWTKTSLANFSGTAIYEKTFTLPEAYRGKELILDLGRVSSVAVVYVNGREAGTLVWSPYKLDITEFTKPGENHLKIRLTNTEANARAVGTYHRILANIDLCGLEGPVEIVPYTEETLTLKSEKE